MARVKDHLDERQAEIDLVKGLRSLMAPPSEGGRGLTAAEVARALGMHPKGTGVAAWTGRWNPRSKRWEGGRNLPTAPDVKARLARFVHSRMLAWSRDFEKRVPPPPK